MPAAVDLGRQHGPGRRCRLGPERPGAVAWSPMVVATVLALSSAGLHAGWNLLVKTSDDRDLAAWGQFLFGGLLVLPVLLVIGWPAAEAWPYLVASALVHVAYVTTLALAYTHGDFSLTYPLARGGGAFLAALGGVALLGDSLDPLAWLAIVIIGTGLVTLAGRGGSRTSLTWALATAAAIGAYTLIDAAGVRASGDAIRYGLALMPLVALTVSVSGLIRGKGPALWASLPTSWKRYALAGVLVTVAYTLVLAALRLAPVGYVAMLRESSVVFGALAGWLLLRERLGRQRLVSSLGIAGGMILLILAR